MIDYRTLPYRVEPMQDADIAEVMEIEHEAFSAPWTANAYRHELHQNEMANYLVLRRQDASPVAARARRTPRPIWRALVPHQEEPSAHAQPRGEVLAYGGFWLMVDEAHISTIATRRDWRGHHLGELMLVALIERALDLHAHVVTLEVRVTNTVAQNLYRKYGFAVAGRRRRYYSDNGEDALIMTTPPIDDPAFQYSYTAHKQKLFERLRDPSADTRDTKATG